MRPCKYPLLNQGRCSLLKSVAIMAEDSLELEERFKPYVAINHIIVPVGVTIKYMLDSKGHSFIFNDELNDELHTSLFVTTCMHLECNVDQPTEYIWR